jgi:Putative prokaryotic signal transducing protein
LHGGEHIFEGKSVMDSFHPDDQIVCLTTAPNPAQAHIWENALREEGIHCQVVGDYLGAGIGALSGLQAEIWVKRQDMIQAQAALQRCSQPEVDPGDDKHEAGVDQTAIHER